jgi:hypothetical protein
MLEGGMLIYNHGIFQRYAISIPLFFLATNPLSALLNKSSNGFKLTGAEN